MPALFGSLNIRRDAFVYSKGRLGLPNRWGLSSGSRSMNMKQEHAGLILFMFIVTEMRVLRLTFVPNRGNVQGFRV